MVWDLLPVVNEAAKKFGQKLQIDLLELDESVFDNVSAAYLAIQDQLEGELEG